MIKAPVFTSSGAAFNAERTHRYRLWRHWSDAAPPLGWLMMNPSTADETVLDPTLRRCVGFARAWGYGGIEIFNVATLRTPSPDELVRADKAGIDVFHRVARDRAMTAACADAGIKTVVVAWGSCPLVCGQAHGALRVLSSLGVDIVCLGRTKDGHPRHPLYMRADTQPIPWEVKHG